MMKHVRMAQWLGKASSEEDAKQKMADFLRRDLAKECEVYSVAGQWWVEGWYEFV